MEQGRGNTSAIPHEMLGTRTDNENRADRHPLANSRRTDAHQVGNVQHHWIRAPSLERPVSNGSHSNGSQRAETALAIVLGELTSGAPLLRIHSQCFTGEVLGSLRCDCNGSARDGHEGHRYGRSRPRDLRISGGPRHWLDGKTAGLRTAGCRHRHRRGQSRAGLQGRLPGFQPAGRDTARPRHQACPPSHE